MHAKQPIRIRTLGFETKQPPQRPVALVPDRCRKTHRERGDISGLAEKHSLSADRGCVIELTNGGHALRGGRRVSAPVGHVGISRPSTKGETRGQQVLDQGHLQSAFIVLNQRV